MDRDFPLHPRLYRELYGIIVSNLAAPERNRTVIRIVVRPFWSSLVYFFPPLVFFFYFLFLRFSFFLFSVPAIIIPSAESRVLKRDGTNGSAIKERERGKEKCQQTNHILNGGERKRPLKTIVSMIFSYSDEKTKRREFTLVSGEWGHDGTGSVIKRNCNIACLLSTSVKWPVSSRLLSRWTINRYEMLIFSRPYRDIALPAALASHQIDPRTRRYLLKRVDFFTPEFSSPPGLLSRSRQPRRCFFPPFLFIGVTSKRHHHLLPSLFQHGDARRVSRILPSIGSYPAESPISRCVITNLLAQTH